MKKIDPTFVALTNRMVHYGDLELFILGVTAEVASVVLNPKAKLREKDGILTWEIIPSSEAKSVRLDLKDKKEQEVKMGDKRYKISLLTIDEIKDYGGIFYYPDLEVWET